MSANLVVDLNNTCLMQTSIADGPVLSGSVTVPCSGAVIGNIVDLVNANTYCNLFAAGVSASGQLRLQVQCSDGTTSGSFTDPTSGYQTFPGAFQSGTILWINSGGGTGTGVLGTFTSGQCIASGFFVAQGFIRTGRYARVLALSGDFFAGGLTVGFISNQKWTGSGAGYTFSPSSGSITV